MSDIELIVRIPEDEYKIIKNFKGPMLWVEHLIKDGIPLPKGHGRLIDEEQIPGDGGWDFSDRLMLTPTIIEADESEREVKNDG